MQAHLPQVLACAKAGRHELKLSFRPLSFNIGLTVTLLTILSAAAVLIRTRGPAKPQ